MNQINRIHSIDIVRGMAMVLMALDHVRDYFHAAAHSGDPLDLQTTTPALFFTRWVTHFCAPVFVFLSGTSIYLQSLRKDRKELGSFVLKRGLWLILMEWSLIAFAWTFNPFFNVLPFQVIWAIGISMVVLGLMLLAGLSWRWILMIGLTVVAGHNLLDIPESAPGFQAGFWWDLLHHGVFKPYEFLPEHYIVMVYPFPVWTAVMCLGFAAGRFFGPEITPDQRKNLLIRTGLGLIVFFILLRFANLYGDPKPWTTQKDFFYTLLSFINTNKYPPSLLFICMILGPAMLLLAWVEKFQNRFTGIMTIFGRTAFFYYILHLYLIHTLSTLAFFARGHVLSDAWKFGEQFPFLFLIPGEGSSLGIVYLVWMAVVALLYPLCLRYDRYKTTHREQWWLSYL